MKNFTLPGACLLLLLFNGCSKKDTLIPNHSLTEKTKQVNWTPGNPLTNGVYVFKNANSQCFQVGLAANGAVVEQNTYIGLSNQQWDVTDLGSGYYKIANHYSGKVLDVPSGSTAQNLQLQQWDYLNTDNQKWRIDHQGWGIYAIINKGNGLSVTLNNNSTTQFEKITQTTYVANASHRWIPTMVHLPRISIYANKFWGEGGAEFKIWGFNYGPGPQGGGLLEDRWNIPSRMDSIRLDFGEMKALGANVARLHLQFNKFMTSATQPNTEALDRLKTIVGYAETNKIYLIITGLCSYRESDQPSWYTNMTQSQRWATQGIFWGAVAGALANNPTIFGYDLINEPLTPNPVVSTWTSAIYGNYLTRDLAGMTSETVMSNWIATMTNAIRAKDASTPITVGFLPYAWHMQFINQLNYASVHVYPHTGQEAASATVISQFQSSKPLVIEETYTGFDISAAGLQSFIQSNDPYVSGWVSAYMGNTLQDIINNPSLDPWLIQKNWEQTFQSMSPNYVTP